MNRSNITAWLLIIIGGFLLLNYFNLFHFERGTVAIAASFILTLLFFNRTIHNPNRKGLLGTTFFLIMTILLAGMQFGYFPVDDRLGGGIVLVSLGISNLICYVFTRNKISNLVWAFVFIALGSPFIIGYYKLMPLWIVENYYMTYWPGLLIIIGVVVLIDGILRKRIKEPNKTHHS